MKTSEKLRWILDDYIRTPEVGIRKSSELYNNAIISFEKTAVTPYLPNVFYNCKSKSTQDAIINAFNNGSTIVTGVTISNNILETSFAKLINLMYAKRNTELLCKVVLDSTNSNHVIYYSPFLILDSSKNILMAAAESPLGKILYSRHISNYNNPDDRWLYKILLAHYEAAVSCGCSIFMIPGAHMLGRRLRYRGMDKCNLTPGIINAKAI